MHPHQVIAHKSTKPTLSGKQKVIQRNHTELYKNPVFFVSYYAPQILWLRLFSFTIDISDGLSTPITPKIPRDP